MGRVADGWFPQLTPGPGLDAAMASVRAAAVAAGRDPASIGMEGRTSWRGQPERFVRQAERWRAAGATHLCVNTMGNGLADVDAHLAALADAASALRR
jgi:alkanesulfonate monooxygenase SsuD/methylene tetrahydromethanopterin reductase-like flavin-dependent oxidoreductase (luciferase family)